MKASRSYRDDLIRDLKRPGEAVAYLNAALEAKNEKAFLLALRNVIEAHGGMTKLARFTKINRVSLYKMLSKQGNPEFRSVLSLLEALGVRFRIAHRKSSSQKKAA